MIDALVTLMNTPPEVTGTVNLGNPAEFTMLELAMMVLTLTGSNAHVEEHPLPSDDPTRRKPDITRARLLPPQAGLRAVSASW